MRDKEQRLATGSVFGKVGHWAGRLGLAAASIVATLLVIEKVPVISCPHCGASYLSAKTLHEIARIKLHRRSLSKRRKVPVAEFISPQQTG